MLHFYGYSERGMINALIADIVKSKDTNAVVKRFVSWFSFPGIETIAIGEVESATFIVEQSFSEYGDLDFLVLIDHDGGKKTSLLVEGKVKTYSSAAWRLSDEWSQFLGHINQRTDNATSNLFVQLYRKLRLCEYLVTFPHLPRPSVRLPSDSITEKGYSLGENRIVLRAAEMFVPYVQNAYFAMLVPDESGACRTFFDSTLRKFDPAGIQLPAWSVGRFGYATWRGVHECLEANPVGFESTLENFRYNDGQIYGSQQGPVGKPAANAGYLWNSRPVWLFSGDIGKRNCRVVFLDTAGEYFPRSEKVPIVELSPIDPPITCPHDISPAGRAIYKWDPQGNERRLPSKSSPQPTSPCRVEILESGTETCRAIAVNDANLRIDDQFHVYTWHLRRNV